MSNSIDREYRRYFSDHPGHPLGKGMPTGRPLRIDFFKASTQSWKGESHYEAWQRLTRSDPCAYCGESPSWVGDGEDAQWSGTVDHIEPKTLRIRGIGGAHGWTNIAGACSSCNGSKARKSLLMFMLERRGRVIRQPPKLMGIPTKESRHDHVRTERATAAYRHAGRGEAVLPHVR